MSTTATKMPLKQAQELTALLVHKLAPACERIEVAGSVRRLRPEVGDLEIVAIPKMQSDLLGTVYCSMLDERLDRLSSVGWLTRLKGGDKYKQFEVNGADNKPLCKLDLFVTNADCWGCILAIRTGPAEFSKRLVTSVQDGGLRPPGIRFQNGRIVDCQAGKFLETPEEADVFKALRLAWIAPEART